MRVLKGIAFVLIACGVWVLVNAGHLQEFLDAYSRRNQELEQIESLKQRIHKLEKEQASLKANGAASARYAREKLDMHLPGEQVIFLQREGETTAAAAPDYANLDLPPPLPPEPSAEGKSRTAEDKKKKTQSGSNLKKSSGAQ